MPRPDGSIQAAGAGDFSGEWRRWFPQWPAADGPIDPHRPDTFAAALADLVHTLQQEGINDDVHALTMITQGAVGMIAGAEQGGVVVPAGPGRLDGRAAVGDLPELVMKAQNQAGEGPCLDTLAKSTQILVTDLRGDDRWPAFRAATAQWELRSMVCTPMRVRHTTIGSLTLLSTQSNAFGDAAANLAAVFAAHATLALTSVQRVRNLELKADSREVIGRAEGILMQRHHITAEAAHGMLVHASQISNTKLRDVCRQLAETGQLPT